MNGAARAWLQFGGHHGMVLVEGQARDGEHFVLVDVLPSKKEGQQSVSALLKPVDARRIAGEMLKLADKADEENRAAIRAMAEQRRNG